MTQRKEIKVPDIGDFEDVEVVEVTAAVGDTVAVEAPLIVIETDKASMEVPSPHAGRVAELKVEVGSRVSQGTPIAVLEVEEEDAAPAAEAEKPAEKPAAAATPASAVTQAAPAAVAQAVAARSSGAARPLSLPPIDEAGFSQAHASPSVRKFARELGVNLIQVKGSGRKGRVLKDDVKAFVKAFMQGQMPGSALPAVPVVDHAKYGEIEVVELSRIRRISGPRLLASWLNIPHVAQHDEADITDLEERRKALREEAAAKGVRLTVLAFIIRACVLALQEFPDFNSSLTEDGKSLVRKKYHHIGFAADTPQGLVVPVIRDADSKDVLAIAGELGELSARAREGKLRGEEMQGGTFTVSSLGGIGGSFFTPIINAPEVAILGVGRSAMRPVWQDEAFAPRLILPLSLSYDHRVIDGASGVRFTTFLARLLAEPQRLMD